MLPDRVSNPGSLTYESGALPIALRGPVSEKVSSFLYLHSFQSKLFEKGEVLYKRSAFVLIPFVLYTILYVCMLLFTK